MQFCFVCLFFLQNGKWVDLMCGEKKDFICMKTSASTPTGEAAKLYVAFTSLDFHHGIKHWKQL